MLDSIREIFDILDFQFQSVGFDFIQYENFNELISAIEKGKCPVVDVLNKYFYSSETAGPKNERIHIFSEKDGSHVVVATGIRDQNGMKEIQLKNSFADNPNEQGNVHHS